MNKQALREKYKSLRLTLSSEQADEESLKIANQCLKLPIWNHQTYHIFLPIAHQKEVNTEYLLHILQGKDKNVALSKSDFSTQTLQHFLLTEQTKIEVNAWGIPEPTGGFQVNEEQIDVVFVPLLAFDKKGNRVGYGKGFYDRFLAKCKPSVCTIGLSFFEAENEISDINDTDFSLDYVVSPEKIYTFKEK